MGSVHVLTGLVICNVFGSIQPRPSLVGLVGLVGSMHVLIGLLGMFSRFSGFCACFNRFATYV